MLRLYNPRPSKPVVNWRWTVGLLAAHGLALLALVWLGLVNPKIPEWISEGAEAELAAAVPPAVASEIQMARPAGPMRTARVAQRFYK
jgi:predicted MFS family arabinose efflux permease